MPSLPLPHREFEALLHRDAEAASGSVPVGKAHLKELRTLGHKVVRFLTARAACARQLSKHHHSHRPAWLDFTDRSPGPPQGDGLFACAARLDATGLHLPLPVIPSEFTSPLASLWQRVDTSAPASLPSSLQLPGDANAPRWLALLRLRPLREVWERELRRDTLQALLNLLPDAWMLDSTPVPEGAVLPRLEIAAWSDLPSSSSPIRRFVIVPADTWDDTSALDDTLPRASWSPTLQLALGTPAPHVLVSLPDAGLPSPTWIVAFCHKHDTRVDTLGFLALSPDAGRLVPARVESA